MFTTVYFLPLKDKQDELITGKSVEKGMIFYRQPSKMQINFNRQTSRYFKQLSNVTFSADLYGLLASEESLNGKN